MEHVNHGVMKAAGTEDLGAIWRAAVWKACVKREDDALMLTR